MWQNHHEELFQVLMGLPPQPMLIGAFSLLSDLPYSQIQAPDFAKIPHDEQQLVERSFVRADDTLPTVEQRPIIEPPHTQRQRCQPVEPFSPDTVGTVRVG